MLLLVGRGRVVLEEARAYARAVPRAEPSVLFMGDSTGVGTGAIDPNESIAGRFGEDITDVHIDNVSENGLRVEGLRRKFEVFPDDTRYDLIMLMIGGNDVIRFTDLDTFRADLRETLRLASEHTDTVAMMSSGNMGHAVAWSFVLSRIYDARSRAVRRIILEEVERADVVYTDVFEGDRAKDPFLLDPQHYHARDGLHPSGEGYRLWYEQFVARWREEEEHWLTLRYLSG